MTERHPPLTPVTLIGVPLQEGTDRRGANMGPDGLRAAGLIEQLQSLDLTVSDMGNLAPDLAATEAVHLKGNARDATIIAAWTRLLDRTSYETIRAGQMPVFLGGDHALSMGSVSGAARYAKEQNRPLFVLWVDAHSDFNTPETSPSGNMHGMPVAMLCNEPGFAGLAGNTPAPTIDPGHVHMIGIRSIDKGERELLKARGINVIDMRKIDEEGIVAPMQAILEQVRAENGLLHVSLDVDSIDPDLAPGVGTPVPGGLTYREAHLIMEMIHDAGLMTSLDVVELNPYLDDRGKSGRLLVELVASAFGQAILDRPNTPFS